MDKEKKNPIASDVPSDAPERNPEMDELYRKLQPEMRRPKPSADAIAAALEAAQRLAAEADAEQAADDAAQELIRLHHHRVPGLRIPQPRRQQVLRHVRHLDCRNRRGQMLPGRRSSRRHASLRSRRIRFSITEPEDRPMTTRPTGQETHHYHHHYHHHYFPGGEAMAARSAADPMRDVVRDPIREDKMRPTAALRGDMSRAEAAVRRIAHEWVLACNTKHLDDLLDLYTPDALVLRSNCPPVRGASAVREFFFGALDAGLGEVEVEPLRVEVVGDLAYEAGRCKALIPSATGKRREERGKYLWVCARQTNGEWKLAADCWSSDLTLSTLESEVPQGSGVKTSLPRKNP